MELRNISALVTGGASGLGAATAELLASRGARVAIFDLDAARGEALAARIGGAYFNVNVAEDGSAASGIAAAEAVHGIARVLVNCAGIAPGAKTVGRDNMPHPLDIFRKAVEVNLIGSFNVAAKFAARLATADAIGEERGVIVNTASIAAFEGQIGQCAYAASKGGVVAVTLPMARDLASLKIRVMTIAPGPFLTPMVAAFPQEVQDSIGAQVPHPSRLGRPEEYARMVEAIIANPMLNGETIRFDGAVRLAPR